MKQVSGMIVLAAILGATAAYGECERAGQEYVDAALHAERFIGSGIRGPQSDPRIVLNSLNQAVAMGNPDAEFQLGQLYLSGQAVERNLGEAAAHYERAAACHVGKAEYQIGAMTEVGWVYPKSWTEAAKWYQRAGEDSDPRGYSSLGLIALLGRIGPRNVSEAIRNFTMAAKLGSHNDGLFARALQANPNIMMHDQLVNVAAAIKPPIILRPLHCIRV